MDASLRFLTYALKPRHLGPRAEVLSPPPFVADPISWQKTFDLAERLSAETTLFRVIQLSQWKSDLPESVFLHIEERLQRERLIRAIQDQILDEVLFLLIGAKVPFVLGGDFDLARRYYPDSLYKPIRYLDVLISPLSLATAERALTDGGFRVLRRQDGVLFARTGNAPVLRVVGHPGGPELIARGRPIQGLPAGVLGVFAEDHFIELVRACSARQLRVSPVWLNDLHFVVRHPDFLKDGDWDRLAWLLARERTLSASWLLLRLLREDWDTAISEDALRGFDQRLGGWRKRMLLRFADHSEWFGLQPPSKSIRVQSRFLLARGTWESVTGAVREALF